MYAVRGDPSRAIKLYLQPDAAHEAKVRAMIAARLAEKCVSVTFPLQIVHRADGSLGGFTMRRVSDSLPIFELFASGSRRERFARADWAFLVRTATNVARVVAQVHAGGAVIGDVNSAGFLVSQRATVTLIDADSFQVAGHRCRVGMPEYTPSELQGMRFGEVDRTVDHDAFGLAVMIFQLLALGRHPHAGVRNGRSIPLETAITQARFAYSLIRNVGSMPPPAALTLRDLPLGIRTLFERAFALRMGPRPTAQEWVSELALLEAGLVRCLNNSAHIIPTLAVPCPWCRIEKALGQSLFPASRPGGSALQPVRTDLHHEVARVVQYARDHAGEDIQPLWRRCNVVPSKAAVKLLAQDGKVPAGPIAALQVQLGLDNQRTRRVFVERYNAAQAAAAQALDRWRIDLGVWEINTRAEKLQQNLIGWDRLRASTPVLLAQVTERAVSGAAIERMRTMPLDTAGVPGIGENLRSHLVRHGVATAADVTRAVLSTIFNLGEARSAALLLWRDRIMVKAQRSIVGNRPLLDGAIAAGMTAMRGQIANAEDALRAQCADLEHRVSKIRKRVWLVDRQVEDALHDRDQAAMDLELLGIDNKALLALSKVPPSPAQTVAPPKAKKRPKTAKRQPVVCPACGAPMVKRWANAAKTSNKLFLGCSTYPRCSGSRPVHRKPRSP
ncbi:topoisomerase DNA-binding C4 zinc finger domain-containing protein [Sphingomonas sp. Leaf25]|uniref:topoisomerase DNA-binding C4 zinc finger domain-containing protein n=1 Tax=Sphingomonas sp. Leaf25 TaxID=1735692 RepID=UPI00070016B3|nr:topoisomerase DNA-binding C4 zinc finger domain-containing protein [Sphingomonas sp. Leaf25]KQN01453.1 hypothetical protein ASE78_17400 [Sphingomonas sp. Leaf25]